MRKFFSSVRSLMCSHKRNEITTISAMTISTDSMLKKTKHGSLVIKGYGGSGCCWVAGITSCQHHMGGIAIPRRERVNVSSS